VIGLEPISPDQPEDEIEIEAMLLLEGFMILDPNIDSDAAYDYVYEFVMKCANDPGFYGIDSYLSMITNVKNAKSGPKVVH
jgi:hypothetical protein